MSLRRWPSLILFLLLAGFVISSGAQAWPTKPIRFVIPFGAGGPVDFSTRVVAAQVGEQLGQSVLVENRPGGSGNIGVTAVLQAPADGHVFLVTGVGPLAINPALFASLPYDVERDFIPVVTTVQYPQVLAVAARVPVKSVTELIALAKAQPGKLNYGSPGVGSSGHLITESFLKQAGIQITHIPYKGGSTTTQGLLSGDVDLVIDGLPSFMAQREQIRVLAVSSAERWPLATNLPSIAEDGGLPGFDFTSWVMLAAPRGTPQQSIDRLAAEVTKALGEKAVQERMRTLGAIGKGGTPADAKKFFQTELAKWKRIVEASGARQN